MLEISVLYEGLGQGEVPESLQIMQWERISGTEDLLSSELLSNSS